MKLSEKITKLRKEKNLSQEDLGNEINVSRQAISKWESEQTKPDIDKLKDLAKYFNVSFDYLLNDELDEIPETSFSESSQNDNKNTTAQNSSENNTSSKKSKSHKKHPILKILLVILIIYLLICIYKFIALYRYYKIADSFSEENYWMSEIWFHNNEEILYHSTTKIGNKILEETQSPTKKEYTPCDAEGNIIPHRFGIIDWDKNIYYELCYNYEDGNYRYSDRRPSADNEDDFIENYLCKNKNLIKEYTLGTIPSDFKSIFLASINPLYNVVVHSNTIYIKYLEAENKYTLSNDGLITGIYLNTKFNGNTSVHISYDYVQDHFNGREIKDPIETYNLNVVDYPY